MTPLDILKAGRARIEDPKNWTTAVYARDRGGNYVEADAPEAVAFCAFGAVYAAEESRYFGPINCAADYLRNAAGSGASVLHINDNEGHSAVLALYDKAIAAAAATEATDAVPC